MENGTKNFQNTLLKTILRGNILFGIFEKIKLHHLKRAKDGCSLDTNPGGVILGTQFTEIWKP